jgi:hypothetical protein
MDIIIVRPISEKQYDTICGLNLSVMRDQNVWNIINVHFHISDINLYILYIYILSFFYFNFFMLGKLSSEIVIPRNSVWIKQ